MRQPVESSRPQDASPSYDRFENHPASRLRNLHAGAEEPLGSKDISARLDANLQEMCTSISRLKGLATDLSYEIDSQNDLIDNITNKTDVSDLAIQKQNKDMNRLMKK